MNAHLRQHHNPLRFQNFVRQLRKSGLKVNVRSGRHIAVAAAWWLFAPIGRHLTYPYIVQPFRYHLIHKEVRDESAESARTVAANVVVVCRPPQ